MTIYIALGLLAFAVIVLAIVLPRSSANQQALPPPTFAPRADATSLARDAHRDRSPEPIASTVDFASDDPLTKAADVAVVSEEPAPGLDAPELPSNEARQALLAECESLARTNKIAAIKRWRTATGVGLREAKALVDALVEHGVSGVSDAMVAGALGNATVRAATDVLAPAQLDLTTIEARRTWLAEYEALARTDKIAAIKQWRNASCVGLREAKELIDALVALGASGVPVALIDKAWGNATASSAASHDEAVSEPEPTTDEARRALLAECVNIAHRQNKIAAIKHYRERTGATLHDAKDAVERAMTEV